MSVSYSDLKLGLTKLGLTDRPVSAHASLKAFGPIAGGAETVFTILLASVRGVIIPTFSYKTMITPEVGPPNNAIAYSDGQDQNRMAEPFHVNMPVDPTMGILPRGGPCTRSNPSQASTPIRS